MYNLSRREFICLSAYLSLLIPFRSVAATAEKTKEAHTYQNTIFILGQAFKFETIARNHYVAFSQRALAENYPNIAYMFQAFSLSEQIHADNYRHIINHLGGEIITSSDPIYLRDTKSNLIKAAENELEKIEKIYPEYLRALALESHEEAIINCMYSWKSHRQHEEKVNELLKYSGFFWDSLASHIEEKNFAFHVCAICGSTIDREPLFPCEICNRNLSHYRRVDRPV